MILDRGWYECEGVTGKVFWDGLRWHALMVIPEVSGELQKTVPPGELERHVVEVGSPMFWASANHSKDQDVIAFAKEFSGERMTVSEMRTKFANFVLGKKAQQEPG